MKNFSFGATIRVAVSATARAVIFASAIFAALVFVSCDPVGPDGPSEQLFVIGFESAPLDDSGVLLDSYTENNITFVNHNPSEGYWFGFAVSDHHDTTTPGYDNQYSAWPEWIPTGSDDHNASKNFAVGYYSSWEGPGMTQCRFSATGEMGMGGTMAPQYLYLANATYTALDMTHGSDFSEAFGEGDYLKVTITGHGEADVATGKADVYLADFRDGKSYICDEWLKVDLTPLGDAVKRIEFTCESSDEGTPTYFCVDDFAFIASVPSE